MARRLTIETLTVLALLTLGFDVAGRITAFELQFDFHLWMHIQDGYLRTERFRAAIPSEDFPEQRWLILGCNFFDAVIVGDWRRTETGSWERYIATGERHRLTFLYVPLWMPLILFAAYPCIAFIRGPMRHYRRKRRGRCPTCGYDLTGNTSGRCPECGTAT